MGKRVVCWIVAMTFVIGITSCAAKKRVVGPTEPDTVEEPDIRGGEYDSDAALKTAYFDYNKSALRKDSKAALKENAEYLKDNVNLEILIEGYCDERGTIEYNMVLGQRRASAVRNYLGKLGISRGRISTISYGEERPVDYGHNEAAWSKNRRAEIKVRETAPSEE